MVSGGEAGARDRTSASSVDVVDENVHGPWRVGELFAALVLPNDGTPEGVRAPQDDLILMHV